MQSIAAGGLEDERVGSNPGEALARLSFAVSAELGGEGGQQRDRPGRRLGLPTWVGDGGVVEVDLRPRERERLGDAKRPIEERGRPAPQPTVRLPTASFVPGGSLSIECLQGVGAARAGSLRSGFGRRRRPAVRAPASRERRFARSRSPAAPSL
jgi:hypothetical protein